jgi:exodeoxyribonuclease VII small subunit
VIPVAVKKPTFEEAMARLETIVAGLEKGDVPLEEAMGLFEEGTALMKQCSQALDKAEQKVAKLISAADGSPVEEPMEEMEL